MVDWSSRQCALGTELDSCADTATEGNVLSDLLSHLCKPSSRPHVLRVITDTSCITDKISTETKRFTNID